MQADNPLPRLAAALAGVLVLVLFVACGVRVNVPPPPAPSSAPQPQPPTPTPPRHPEPVVRLKAYELFDMGQDGENKYKGQVVGISGLVDVNNTKRPGPGGTSTLIVQGKPDEPPYAIATFGHDSEALLFAGTFQPPSVSLHGIYRGRDERGTVLLDNARVVSLTHHMPVFDFRRDDPRKPRKTPLDKKSAPVAISADKLAQGLQDDLAATYKRYYGVPLRIDGVVARQMQDKGAITMLQLKPLVTDRKTSKEVDFVIFCSLRKPVPVDSPAAADLAVGKRVRLVGNMFAAGNGQATLGPCDVEKQGSEK
jgi:hypothetical protein